MLRRCQDGRLLLVLLLVATGCCVARPQLDSDLERRDRSLPSSTSSSTSGASTFSPVTPTASSRHQSSDQAHSRHKLEKFNEREAGDIVITSETLAATKKLTGNETSRSSKNSTAAQLGQSIQTMASQLLASQLMDDDSMVEADIRTPPKIQSQLEHKHKQNGDGHGIAVPVIVEEGEDVEETIEKLDRVGSGRIPPPVTINKTSLVHVTSKPQTTTPSQSFSTWILLSGSNSNTSQPTVTKKSKPSFFTTGKPITTRYEQNKLSSLAFHTRPSVSSVLTSTMTPSVTRPSTYFTRVVTSNPPHRKTSTSKPFSVESNHTNARINTTMKPLLPTITRRPNPVLGSKTKNQTRLDTLALSSQRKPTTTSTTTTSKPHETNVTTKEDIPVTVSPEQTEDSTASLPEDETTATTKRTRRPGLSEKKKRKKNKNRHRRPTKKPDEDHELESKVTDEEANVASIAATKERPLSTRIYNYLAREVMPSVGVGLLGLVFTAGLAGLIMYPFGGGAARKTYEELQTSQGAYNGYNSEVDREGGMSDAEAFGKVLAGMKEDQMSSYNNVGGVSTVYGSRQETRYGDAASRFGGGRIEPSQESALGHTETKQNFGSSHNTQTEKYGEDYSRNKYSQSYPVYNNRGIRYRQVGIGSSYPVNHQIPETQEVTLEDKITPVALKDRSFATSKTPSVQRGPIPQPTVEHGPRSLSRRRREVLPEKNDMDNEIIPSSQDQNKLTNDTTLPPTNNSEADRLNSSSTTVPLKENIKNNTRPAETSEENNMIGVPDLQNVLDVVTTLDPGTSEETTFSPTTAVSEDGDFFSPGFVTEESNVTSITDNNQPPEPFSVFGLLKQLVQFKIQLGLNLLRNSSAAFTRYLEEVQKRMDSSYRNNVKRSANIQEIRNRTMLRRIARNNF